MLRFTARSTPPSTVTASVAVTAFGAMSGRNSRRSCSTLCANRRVPAVSRRCTVSSEILSVTPSATACSAAANAAAAAASRRDTASFAGDDIDLSVADLDRIAGEPHAGEAGVAAGAHVELEAVPRTDDVQRAGAVVDAEAATLRIEALLDALHQLALADRAALMRALVPPRVIGAVDTEHADLDLVVDDDLALAVRHLGLARDENLSHPDDLKSLRDRKNTGLRRATPDAPRRRMADRRQCRRRRISSMMKLLSLS